MPTLWRKTFRDLLAARWQTAGLALLVTVVVALMAGAGRARGMMVASRAEPLQRLKAADLDVRCSPTLPDVLREVRDLPGVVDSEERMLLEGVVRRPGMPTTPAVVRILPASMQPRIFQLELLEGRWPEPGEEALLVDRSVKRHRHVEVGTQLEIEILDQRRTLPVVGVVLDAEHLLHPAHPDFEVPIPGALAALYASPAAGARLPYADRVDSLLFRFADDADPDALETQIRERLSVAILAMVPAHQQRSLRITTMILTVFDIYMPTVSTVLIAVALALFVMTISRQVRRQRAQIGTLLAIGQHRRTIALSMLGMAIAPVILGGLLGGAIHSVIAHLNFDAHAVAIGWPPLVDPGPGPEVVVTSLVAAGVAMLACLVPVLLTARLLPARLLRAQPWGERSRPGGVAARAASTLRDVLRLPLHVVLGVTTVLRRRWATATAAVALAANLAVVLAFLFVHISHNREVQRTFDRLGLDAVAYFDRPVPTDTLNETNEGAWTKIEPQIMRIAWMEMESQSSFTRLRCLDPTGWIRRFPLVEGRPFSHARAHEVHIDHWFADAYRLGLGDRLRCYPNYSAPEAMELEVVGILGGVSMGFMVLPLEAGRELYELPDLCTGAHVRSDLPREELLASLYRLPHVVSATHMDDARHHVQRTFQASRFVLTLAIVLAMVVAVIFLGILASLDASERSRDFAILRAIGWEDRKVLGMCVTEVVTRGYLAILLALPAAPILGRWIIRRIEEANHYRMPLHDETWVYLSVALAGCVLIPLSALPAWRTAVTMPAGRIARLLGQE